MELYLIVAYSEYNSKLFKSVYKQQNVSNVYEPLL